MAPKAEKMSAEPSPWTVHLGDARNTARFLEGIARGRGKPRSAFISTTITSPPYANLVDYGVDNQIGYRQTYDDYLRECHSIFEAVHKWTKPDGALWIVADSVVQRGSGSAPGSLRPLPFDLARVAEEAGWILRDVVIWRKDRTRPWSNKGRLRNGFEYVLFLVKSDGYKYHLDRLRETRSLQSWWVKYPERHNPWGMAPDNVWEIPIPVQGSWATPDLRHACPFPDELVRRILMLSTDKGDVVFDPFSGSGMVAAVSEAEGRRPLGTELNQSFIDAYRSHVRGDVSARYESQRASAKRLDMTARLLALRVLKYPKDLLRQLLRGGHPRHDLLGAIVSSEPFDLTSRSNVYATANVLLVVADSTPVGRYRGLLEEVGRLRQIPPLSKYSLAASVSVARVSEVELDPSILTYSVYKRGQTWRSSAEWSSGDAIEKLVASSPTDFPPVLSPIFVNEVLEET